jgi:hypothetical protein
MVLKPQGKLNRDSERIPRRPQLRLNASILKPTELSISCEKPLRCICMHPSGSRCDMRSSNDFNPDRTPSIGDRRIGHFRQSLFGLLHGRLVAFRNAFVPGLVRRHCPSGRKPIYPLRRQQHCRPPQPHPRKDRWCPLWSRRGLFPPAWRPALPNPSPCRKGRPTVFCRHLTRLSPFL